MAFLVLHSQRVVNSSYGYHYVIRTIIDRVLFI